MASPSLIIHDLKPYVAAAYTAKPRMYHTVKCATAAAAAYLKPGHVPQMPLFAMDKDGTSGAKKYILGGWDELFALVAKVTKIGRAHYYEVLHSNVPLRLYFDLDFPAAAVPDSAAALDRCTERIVAALRTLFPECPASSPVFVPVVLNASNAQKASRHLVFADLWLPTMADVKEVAEAVVAVCSTQETGASPSEADGATHTGIESLGGNVCGIDRAVYTNGRLLRVWGSTKRNKPLPLRTPFVINGHTDLDPATFFRSLVSPYVCEAEDGVSHAWRTHQAVLVPEAIRRPTIPDSVARVVSKKRKRLRAPPAETVTVTNGVLEGIQARLDRFLRLHHPQLTHIYHDRRGDTLKATLCPGIPCPNNRNRPHRSNKTWFELHLRSGFGQYVCCDPECRGHNWGRRNCGHLVRKRIWKTD